MTPRRTQLVELHVRFEPALAARLRGFAAGSERTLAGCVRLLVKESLDRLDLPAVTTSSPQPPTGEP